MGEIKCQVIEITRGTTHDGPGVRTTVFFKGCPLHCLWCQNPEGIQAGQDVWWEERRCIRCLACLKACPANAVTADEAGLHIERSRCTVCGACVEECPSTAMSFTGREWPLAALVKEVLKDKDYYQAFGGGVTASGGEPLCQYEFVTQFFERLRAEGVNTALDTCGLAPADAFRSVLPHTDTVLFDIKIIEPRLHEQYTGQSNEIILQNLLSTADHIRHVRQEMKLWIRTPLIPDATATEGSIAAIGGFIRDNLRDVVERWELCAFNPACRDKYNKKMGRAWEYEQHPLMRQGAIDRIKTVALATGISREKLVVSGLIVREDAGGG